MRKTLNPVLRRELLAMTRSWRLAWMLMGYLLVLALASLPLFFSLRYDTGNLLSGTAGSTLFLELACLQAVLLGVTVPSIAASSISAEREKQTLDVLLCTRMSPRRIVLGKLGASVAGMLLLTVGMLPLFSLGMLLGGVTLWQVLAVFGFYLVFTLMLSSIGIGCSALFKRTRTAGLVTYLIFGALLLIPFIAWLIGALVEDTMGLQLPVELLMWLNPVIGFVGYMEMIMPDLLDGALSVFSTGTVYPDFFRANTWWIHLAVEGLIAWGSLAIAAHCLSPKARHRVKKEK
nr:ABC transporter permease [bacterium]